MRKNIAFLRETLGAAILQVRSGRATSRTALAQNLGISPSTVGLYVDRLIADKFLDESGVNQGKMGRPQRLLATCAEAGWFAGVEFNAHRIQFVAVDFSGHSVESQVVPLPRKVSAEHVLQSIVAGVKALTVNMKGPLLAVGVGVPGLVDPETGTGVHFAFIPDWKQVPVSAQLASALNVPIILQNNLRSIALAERWFGMGHSLSNYIILGPRSGFGIAMVQDGRLINGANHAAGEVGRWPWPPGAPAGSAQEMHHMLSAPTTWRRLANASEDEPLPENLREALANFADAEGKIWDEICTDFARVVGSVQLITDTGLFILHGPLTALGERFCESIVSAAHALCPALADFPLKVVPSHLGDDAGALGAASLAMEAWAPE